MSVSPSERPIATSRRFWLSIASPCRTESHGTRRWDGVKPAGMKRVAAHQPARSQPGAAKGPVGRERIERVLRARGMEAAGGRHHRRKEAAVEANRQQQDLEQHPLDEGQPAAKSAVTHEKRLTNS